MRFSLVPVLLMTAATSVLSACAYDEPRRGDGTYNDGRSDRGYEQRGRDEQRTEGRRDDRNGQRSEQGSEGRKDDNSERGNRY
jgi:hypothetical protein